VQEPDSDLEFLITRPGEIDNTLFELMHDTSRVSVRVGGGTPVAVRLRDLDREAGIFHWEPREASLADVQRLAGAASLRVEGDIRGVQVRFDTLAPRQSATSGQLHTFASPIPESLVRLERRAFFRIQAGPPWLNRCSIPGMGLELRVHDVSLEGIGLRCAQPPTVELQPGMVLEQAPIDFRGLGSIQIDLLIRAVYPAPSLESTQTSVPVLHLGCSYESLSRQQENWLQRLMYQLEVNRRKLG
jgi:c-di-GMP-binding flagellar brake protein YcgR